MEYKKTHKWITFSLDLSRISASTWVALGEAQSKCEHLAGSALSPEQAAELYQIYLAKGALATTAIEGNTLSESEVLARLEGNLELPPSKEYLGQEIDNIIEAANAILKSTYEDDGNITIDEIKEFNNKVLQNLALDEDVISGDFRKHGVTVGRYRGAPAVDLDYLMQQFVEILNGFPTVKGQEIVYGLVKAVFAHIYLAWIHPFGDGNGRTARLIEVKILLQAGVPSSAAHLLSNHYNETRREYYRQLDAASRSGGDIIPFINYAVQGFVDQIRGQIKHIRAQQLKIVWINYVHEKFKTLTTPKDLRRKDLLLYISESNVPYKYGMGIFVTKLYAGKSNVTFTRDINYLISEQLIKKTEHGYLPNLDILTLFFPVRKKT